MHMKNASKLEEKRKKLVVTKINPTSTKGFKRKGKKAGHELA